MTVARKETFQGQNSQMKIYFHHPLYHIPSPGSQKDFLTAQKSLKVLKPPRAVNDGVLLRFFSDRLLFDRLFFRVFSDRFLTWVISVFFQHTAVLLSKRGTTFLLKIDILWITFTKLITKNMNKYFHDRDTKYYIENICNQFPNS